jgi:hypothetical protein
MFWGFSIQIWDLQLLKFQQNQNSLALIHVIFQNLTFFEKNIYSRWPAMLTK